MPSFIYADCRKEAHYAECRYAECRGAQPILAGRKLQV
jgi:hypothetical protein